MRASTSSIPTAPVSAPLSARSPAWPMTGARFSISTSPAPRRSLPRPCAGSESSTRSRTPSAAARVTKGDDHVRSTPFHGSPICEAGSMRRYPSCRQDRTRQDDPLRPRTLARAHPLCRPGQSRDRQQGRRTRNPAARHQPQELALRRLRHLRRTRRHHLHPDRDGQAQRP